MLEKILIYHNRYASELRGNLQKEFPTIEFIHTDNPKIVEKEIANVTVLIATGQKFPQEALKNGQKLKFVQSTSSGVDWLINSPLPKNVPVCRAEGVQSGPVAEYVLGYILADCIKIFDLREQQINKIWERPPKKSVTDMNLGIVGLGMLGREIIQKAYALNMNISGLDRVPVEIDGLQKFFRTEHMAEFLAELDYCVVTVPLNPATEGMFGIEQFKMMNPSSVFINVSRGPVVKENDLITALKEGIIRGAILDVFREEPLPQNSELWSLPNVIVTPHTAGFLAGYKHFMDILINNLQTYFNNENTYKGLVDKSRGF